MTGRRGDRSDSAQAGVVAVEFALVLPILIILLFGIIEFGRAYSVRVSLTHAAHEAVRVVALDTGDATATATAAAQRPVTVTIVSSCPSGTVGDAEVVVSDTIDLVIPLVPVGSVTIEQSARMRCGSGA